MKTEIPGFSRRNFLSLTAGLLVGGHPSQTLGKGAGGRGEVSFGVCTDIHKDLIHDADSRLQCFVNEMTELDLDFIMQLGDFCQPHGRNQGFMYVWNSYQGDSFHVLGNHDVDGGFSWDQTMEFYGMDAPFYSFDRGGFHFIVLDCNNKPEGHTSGYPAYVGKKQLEWLETDLSRTEYPTFIFSHQSLTDACGGQVVNFKAVQAVVNRSRWNSDSSKVVACINGHTHLDHASQSEGVHYLSLNSMSYFWMGAQYEHSHYGGFIEEIHPAQRLTVPYDAPLFAVVTIKPEGEMLIEGKRANFVPPTPAELGRKNQNITPAILDRTLRFTPRG